MNRRTSEGKAAILAIGTELTTGQITNRNAAWISDKLVQFGIEVVLHETVADDRAMIYDALERCASLGQFVFVTGGLGPTTDDFTREVVSQWLDDSLVYQEEIWKKVCDRLNRFSIPIAESNRQQCFFPSMSQILLNSAGTAAGFTSAIPKNQGRIWVLPGPPPEVATIWENGIDKMLHELLPNRVPLHLFTWQCMGKSEAELGEITERTLAGSGLQTGYRAHRPIVEVKVWCPETEIIQKQPWLQKIDQELKPFTLTRQGEDLAENLLHHLKRSTSVEIIDSATGGLLTQRLGTFLRNSKYENQALTIAIATEWCSPSSPEEWVSEILQQVDHTDEESLTLIVSGFTPTGEACIGMREKQRVFQQNFQSYYKSAELIDRMRHEIVERAIQKWCEWLGACTN